MKNTIRYFLTGVALFVLHSSFFILHSQAATSTPAGFTDNLDQALAAAKTNGKYVYACFSGSDWCYWCRKLDKEVLSKKKFLVGVTNDFELVFIDMPEDLTLLSERAQTENEKLVAKYGVRGFPTAIVFDSNGEILTRTGYREGGAKKYAAHLMEIRAKGPQIRIEEELIEKHLVPFETEIRKIVVDGMMKRIEAAVSSLPKDEQKAKADELLRQYLPETIKQIEDALAKFKAAEIPEMISSQKAQLVQEIEDLIEKMRKDLK